MSNTSQTTRRAALALLGSTTALISTPALAKSGWVNIPTPSLKPRPPSLSKFLSDRDAKLFRTGLTAARRRRWISLKNAKDSMSDPVAKDVLRWLRAARDPNVPMDYLTYAVQSLSGWPRMVGIQAKAEGRLFDDPISHRRMIEWFGGREPVAGEGRAALARAYYGVGQTETGDRWMKLAWRESRLTRDRQKKIFGRYRKHLTADDHYARADHLIWQGKSHFSKALALVPHMSKADGALITARIKLAQNASGMDAALKAVPTVRRGDPGLLYERARWRRQKKTKNYALPVYLQIKSPPTSDHGKVRMWSDKRIMIYWLIEEGRFDDAYELTRYHGATKGIAFYEPEFVGGWLALTKLNKPQVALKRFKTLEQGVSTPISLARAHYWQGRAHSVLGDGQAENAYRLAAQYPNTYYGQLATSELSLRGSQLSLPIELVSEAAKMQFQADARVRALHILGEAGEETYFSQFAFHMDDVVESEEQLSLISELARDYGFMRPSLRAAKQAGRFQTMLTDSGYPTVGPIDALSTKFNKPFVYAIARQESEFAAGAISSAKAYGMMQMISSTAKATARKHRITFDRNRLIHDRDYSAKLGAHHLHDLLDRWDGSYILAAVSYNAGPHRAKSWIKKYGDPRTGQIDPIDWVESIPFSETRNYVQRVIENMQVYRARLNNNTAPLNIVSDLRNGAY